MDSIPSTLMQHDILHYITDELSREGFHYAKNNKHLRSLACKSGGLFEWARLACTFCTHHYAIGLDVPRRIEYIISHHSDDHVPLLDQMYKLTLESLFSQRRPHLLSYEQCLTWFRSVMALVLGTLEPLPLASLYSMERYLPSIDASVLYSVVPPMGNIKLLSRPTDPSMVIRPLHASFADFLTDKTRSGKFFVDTSHIDNELAFATLGIMEDDLGANLCRLSNSYLASPIMSPELSYSCRFWTDHLRNVPFNQNLADVVRAFFKHERLLFWFEALSLLKMSDTSVDSLLSVIQWVKVCGLVFTICTGCPDTNTFQHVDCQDISDDATDARRFIRMFGTPHLYFLSIPSSPRISHVSMKFQDAYSSYLPIVPSNHSRIQYDLRVNTLVMCAAFSPDGQHIVSGSNEGTIQSWDAETSENLHLPLDTRSTSVVSHSRLHFIIFVSGACPC
jgi:hypothetical protein